MKNLTTYEDFLMEAKTITYKMPASDFGDHTHGYYRLNNQNTWRVHGGYAHDRVKGDSDPMEADTVFFEVALFKPVMYIKIGGINNIKRAGASTYGKNFKTTIEEFEADPKAVSKAASDFLTDADHLKWLNKNAKSDGNRVKWVMKDDYSAPIEELITTALKESR